MLGSWIMGAMFEGQGMVLLLTIVQTLAGTPRLFCGHCDTGSLAATSVNHTTGACCILWQQ